MLTHEDFIDAMYAEFVKVETELSREHPGEMGYFTWLWDDRYFEDIKAIAIRLTMWNGAEMEDHIISVSCDDEEDSEEYKRFNLDRSVKIMRRFAEKLFSDMQTRINQSDKLTKNPTIQKGDLTK